MEILINIEGLEDFDAPPTDFWNPFVKDIALRVMNTIKMNTLDGVDADGEPFAAYSKPYAIYREKIGRDPNGDWLRLTGQMMRSLTFQDEGDGTFVIGFEGMRTEKAPKVIEHTFKRGSKKGTTEYKAKKSYYETENKTETMKTLTNAEVAYRVQSGDRKFFGISEENLIDIIQKAAKYITDVFGGK